MKRSSRLNRSEDIQRVRQQGKSFVHVTMVLGCLQNSFEYNQLAVIAGKSVGNAVKRNFAKRRIRSAFQRFQMEIRQGYDLVIVARRPILTVEYKLQLNALRTLLDQAGLMKEKES